MRKQEFWAPMDLMEIIYEPLYNLNKEHKHSSLYWKLAVCCNVPFSQELPEKYEDQIWTLAKLSQTSTMDSSTPNTQILSLYTSEKHPNLPPLRLCIKNVYQEQNIVRIFIGIFLENFQNSELLKQELKGCNSILFLVTSNNFQLEKKRLQNVLEAIEDYSECNLYLLVTFTDSPNIVREVNLCDVRFAYF
jgi:hypothetical protein